MNWQTEEALKELLCELVSWQSINGTAGERQFPKKLQKKLFTLTYFLDNKEHIELHDAGKGRHSLTALYKYGHEAKTVILLSHFDTVDAKEYGIYEQYAFDPVTLTKTYEKDVEKLPEHVQSDIRSGNYLFGRGTMDMKMGLALHLQVIEQAIAEQWPINLLLVTVPDEEVNSAGMRAAVDGLVSLKERFNLSYDLFLNSEPSFAQTRHDENYYIYSGTIGKIMPGALFYGRSTHAGDPLNGISSQYMMAYLTKAMEFNAMFTEKSFGENTPLPICLKSYDLKTEYNAQTSHHTAAFYNVFLFEKSAEQVMETFYTIAQEALTACQNDYEVVCSKEKVEPVGEIQLLTYDELHSYALKKHGVARIQRIKDKVTNDSTLDEREMSIQICDALMLNCPELAPATVLFFAPPYYPAVNSSNHPVAQEKIMLTQKLLKDKFAVTAKQIHYFNGICDLSYVNYDAHDRGWQSYKINTPVWGDVYNIPFTNMQKLQAPVLNIGPLGKDAHQLTERLHERSAFEHTPYILQQVIQSMFDESIIN